ncbi:MAG: hypothetical protein IJW29_03585 [Clostridia bacterium]|nr:hypothetical protein [Clostridia bacterium]
MEQELFERLKMRYADVVEKIIFENRRFFFQPLPIPWEFSWNDDVSFIASYSRKTGVLKVNLNAVDFYVSNDTPLIIECFLIHEIRHRYQSINMHQYCIDHNTCVDAEYARRCIDSYDNYIDPVDENGQTNPAYYYNYVEEDAFAYSHAVMRLKYGYVPYLMPPIYYDADFDNIVNLYMQMVKSKLQFSKE